jgi:hypothetical protein
MLLAAVASVAVLGVAQGATSTTSDVTININTVKSNAVTAPAICEDDASKTLSAHRVGPCPAGSSPVRMAGANIYDALWDA